MSAPPIDLQDGVLVSVIEPDGYQVTIVQPDTVGLTPVGPALIINDGAVAQVFAQTSPSASWLFTHNLNRYPLVDIYDPAGNQVETDVVVTTTQVTVIWPTPTTGSVVLI